MPVPGVRLYVAPGTLALGQYMSPCTGTWEGGISGAEGIHLREGFTVLREGCMDLCEANSRSI